MAFRIQLLSSISLLFAFSYCAPRPADSSDELPKFVFSWMDNNNNHNHQFIAGDVATIRIKVLGEFPGGRDSSLGKLGFSPVLTVNEKAGNSCYISGILVNTASNDTDSWRISFTPITAGSFNIVIVDNPFEVFDSSLHYQVAPGKLYPSVCIPTWMDAISEFSAGSKAMVFIVPRDAFGNNVTLTGEDLNPYNFTVSAFYVNGSVATVPNISSIGWNEFGFIFVEFLAVKAGTFLLDVQGGNQTLNGCPLSFKVNPGPLDVSNCQARWKIETNVWQIYSKMEIFIHQQDKYGNLVPGSYEFDADIVEKETHMLVPVADLRFEKMLPGIQLLSFGLFEPGSFLLTISDFNHTRNISGVPFEYMVFIGYCDGSASIVNGTGLNNSLAGQAAKFSLFLIDAFQYPSFVEIESIRVQIVRANDSYNVQPSISPIFNGNGSTDRMKFGAIIQVESSLAPSADSSHLYAGHSKILASGFDVVFTPERSGPYEIFVFCGNVLLNDGHSFIKEVSPGGVNLSLSGVVKFSPKVAKLIQNEVVVQLMDSFSNPVPLLQSRLKLESSSFNSSGFLAGMFKDNNDGSYTCGYLLKNVGTYEICVSFDGQRFSTCPLKVNAYGGEFFPKAYDDYVAVSEDESVAFEVLGNDFFAGNNASIAQFSKPGRGSLLLNGHVFRYTPYKDYYGDDSFVYTLSDVNGNLATAAVNISILSIPPRFASSPIEVHATEDTISPRFGGFSGFEVRYSESAEDITVTLGTRSGTVLLSPLLMQFFQPISGQLAVEKGEDGANSLILKGCVDVINLALQSVQYIGNENFNGNDTLQVSVGNTNGKTNMDIPVLIEPINDPPFINAPKYLFLKRNGDESLIFDKNRDNFEFSVGDPDLAYYPGSESQFIFAFSVEVDVGYLETSLPAELSLTTELKLQNSHMWQPLQTYVTISKHFIVRASGVRFRGTVNDCNSVLQQLSYRGGEQVAVLTVKVNDMGHYGCSSADCDERISVPMFAEATVSLFQGKPMGLLATHSMGIAVIVEFIIMSTLGTILLFFTCKCAVLLVHERRNPKGWNLKSSTAKNLEPKTQNADPSEDGRNCNLCCSTPFLHCGQPSNFRKRSQVNYEFEEPGKHEVCTHQPSSVLVRQHSVPSFLPLAIEKGKC